MSASNVVYTLDKSQRFELQSNQISTINVEIKDTVDLEIVGLADSKGTFLLNLSGEGTLNLVLNFDAYANWNYLMMNESDDALTCVETINLADNARVNANYGELTQGKHQKETSFNLNGHHSHLDIRTAAIAFKQLNWKFNIVHHAKDTYAMIENYGIVFKGGELGLEVLGHILHGNSRSKTHQVTRVMNMEEKVKAKVYPKLVIDENDVEASHAASVGQPDPETIYYLQSRGLSYEKTIEVITLGYLMPIVEVIENDMIRDQLSEKITAKVIG